MQPPLINIFRTLEEAMFFKNSWLNTQFIFTGVQLLPFNEQKYIQVTNTPNGLNLEDWTVNVRSICGELLGDITDSFMVESLTNSQNGNPQFVWSLKNIQQDFGWGLIYLEIIQSVGETFFTQPFRITNIDNEKTSILNYKYKKSEEYQCIGVNIWYSDSDLLQEIKQYYEESTQSTVTTALTQNRLEYWSTQLIEKIILLKIKEILSLPYLYVNNIRANYYESPEIPKKQGQENFSQMDFTLVFHTNDIYKENTLNSGDFLDLDFDSNDFLINI